MKTLAGHNLSDISNKMVEPLPVTAFKKHPAKSYLTTISPAHMRERLTRVFGIFGTGWGLDWIPANTERFETTTGRGAARYNFAITQATFWYTLVDDSGEWQRMSFPVTGFSDNDNIGDAMAGARTSAISAAAKELLFQLHIYKNKPPRRKQEAKKSEPIEPSPELADLAAVAIQESPDKTSTSVDTSKTPAKPIPTKKPTPNQTKRLHALGKELYPDNWDVKRPEFVNWVTDGRSDSSKHITAVECQTIIDALVKRKGEA